MTGGPLIESPQAILSLSAHLGTLRAVEGVGNGHAAQQATLQGNLDVKQLSVERPKSH